ncbi:MAG: putative rane protein, partial [Bradyrhizobium sp.]|nr:putative rane protein [Bradyrhizobium sp.]
MKRSIIALGCVLLAAPALAQSAGEKTGVNSALGIAPTTADFVKEVAISDMFEIQSSKLAQDKGNASPTALDSSHQSKLDKLKGESGKDFSSD